MVARFQMISDMAISQQSSQKSICAVSFWDNSEHGLAMDAANL